MFEAQKSNLYKEFRISQLDDKEALDLTVSSSRFAEKNMKLMKKSSEPVISGQHGPLINDPLISTTPVRMSIAETKKPIQPINLPDLMDSNLIGEPILMKPEEKCDFIKPNTREAILNRYNEVLEIEKSMMREIIQKDTEREKFLRELMVKLELLQRENQILTAENKSLKEMMSIWKISS